MGCAYFFSILTSDMWLQTQQEETSPQEPWIFRRNCNSIWLLNKYNSKAANMRTNDIRKRKNNLLWGFISWRGFLSKRKKEKKKRKLHLINSHGADIYSISLHVYLYKGNTFFLQTLWIMWFLFFLFILIYKNFFLFGSIFSRMIASFF